MSERNFRRHRRIPYAGPVRVTWQGQDGSPHYARARCVDVSECGLRIETPEPIPARALASLNADRIKLAGSATVRHISRRGSKYILGLELNAALRRGTLELASQADDSSLP